jgi:hypothetical protein
MFLQYNFLPHGAPKPLKPAEYKSEHSSRELIKEEAKSNNINLSF